MEILIFNTRQLAGEPGSMEQLVGSQVDEGPWQAMGKESWEAV